VRELDLPYEVVKVPLRQPDSPIHQVNPLGRVPALQLDDGSVITENGAILPFLADQKPEAGLLAPLGSVERSRILSWVGFLNSEVHGAFRPLNRPERFSDEESAHPGIRTKGRQQIGILLAHLEKSLEDKEWLVGGRFTIADAYLGVFLGWADRQQLLEGFTQLQNHLARYRERPAVKAAQAYEAA
jgi:glutathione S-transferase